MFLAQLGPMIGGVLCGLLIVLVLGTLIGALVLRAACWLYNKIAGGPNVAAAVPEPDFGKAVAIVFVSMLVNVMVSMALTFAFGGGFVARNDPSSQLIQSAISMPISLLVMAGMVTAILPTTFGKGILIALLYLLVAIAIGIVIAVPIVLLMVAAGSM